MKLKNIGHLCANSAEAAYNGASTLTRKFMATGVGKAVAIGGGVLALCQVFPAPKLPGLEAPQAQSSDLPVKLDEMASDMDKYVESVRVAVRDKDGTCSRENPFGMTTGALYDATRTCPDISTEYGVTTSDSPATRALVACYTKSNAQAFNTYMGAPPRYPDLLIAHMYGARGAAELL